MPRAKYHSTDYYKQKFTTIRYAFSVVSRNKKANDASLRVLLSFLGKSLHIGFIFLKTPQRYTSPD